MRLIDADALEEELKKDIMGGLNYRWYINNAPTVVVLEQIQAEIYEEFMTIDGGVHDVSAIKCMEIIDNYMKGE